MENLINVVEEVEEITDPFNRGEFKKQRRFIRYMKKAEKNILSYFNKYNEESYSGMFFESISDLVLQLITESFFCEDPDEFNDLFHLVEKPVLIPEQIKNMENDLHNFYFKYDNSSLLDIKQDFIWDEFQIVMEHFLYEKRMNMEQEITESNFNICALPETPVEYLRIVKELISKVYADLYISYPYYSTITDSLSDDLLKTYQKNMEKMNEIYEIHEKTIKEQENTIQVLKNTIKEKNKKTVSEKEYEKEIKQIEAKYNKLKNSYEKLNEAYSSLKVLYEDFLEEEEKKEIDIEVESIPEIDMNGKYLFIIEPTHKRCKALQSYFPNAQFSSAETKLNNMDCVIFMTNQMAHNGYKSMKEQCKNKGIPFRHCPNTNIDMIKKQIYKAKTQEEMKKDGI